MPSGRNIGNGARQRGLVAAQRPGLTGVGVGQCRGQHIGQGDATRGGEVTGVFNPHLIRHIGTITDVIFGGVLQHLVRHKVNNPEYVDISLGGRLQSAWQIIGG